MISSCRGDRRVSHDLMIGANRAMMRRLPSTAEDRSRSRLAAGRGDDRKEKTVNRARRLVLISPCRDEAKHMRRTLDSVAAQTHPPTLWVVIDDGSSDATPAILQEYARK